MSGSTFSSTLRIDRLAASLVAVGLLVAAPAWSDPAADPPANAGEPTQSDETEGLEGADAPDIEPAPRAAAPTSAFATARAWTATPCPAASDHALVASATIPQRSAAVKSLARVAMDSPQSVAR